MQPKVSVIIPVYGVEHLIERCARSLFEQTLDSIEFLFINDCTPDKSIEVLRSVLSEYPNREEQVHIIRMPFNQGQAKVRNKGISLAKGEYTIHCDSDDWVEPIMYERMYEEAKKNKADVVVCDYNETDSVSKRSFSAFQHSNEKVSNKLSDWNCAGQLWNKLFRTELYSKIILPQDNMGEDMAMVSQMIYFCKRIIYIREPYYNFFHRPDSITHDTSDERVLKNFLQACNNARIVERFYNQIGMNEETRRTLVRIKYQERSKIQPIIRHKNEYYLAWKNAFPEINKAIWFEPALSIKEKLKHFLILLHLYPLK